MLIGEAARKSAFGKAAHQLHLSEQVHWSIPELRGLFGQLSRAFLETGRRQLQLGTKRHANVVRMKGGSISDRCAERKTGRTCSFPESIRAAFRRADQKRKGGLQPTGREYR